MVVVIKIRNYTHHGLRTVGEVLLSTVALFY